MKNKKNTVTMLEQEWVALHAMLAKHRQELGELKTQLDSSRDANRSNLEELNHLDKLLREANNTILNTNSDLQKTREESKLRHDKFVVEEMTNMKLSELNREQSNTINTLRSLLVRARRMVAVALQEES